MGRVYIRQPVSGRGGLTPAHRWKGEGLGGDAPLERPKEKEWYLSQQVRAQPAPAGPEVEAKSLTGEQDVYTQVRAAQFTE